MPDIFLSYNREDQPKAKLMAKALEADGFDVWWDTVLRAGETYDEVTEKRLRDAKAVVVLWSTRSVRSKWVRAEATLGDRKSALIPVMIEPCERPIMFELIQTADLTHWSGDTNDAAWTAFVDDVREKVGRKAETAIDAAPNTIETAYWMSVSDGSDPAEFRSYLRRYPEGHFAELAQQRLDVLTAQATRAAEVETREREAAERVAQEKTKVAALAAAPSTAPAPARPTPVARPKVQPMIAAALGVLVIAGVSAFIFWPRAPAEPAAPTASVTSQPETPPLVSEPTPSVPSTEIAAETAPTPATAEPSVSAPAAPEIFRDCETCPEMKRLSGGAFMIGSPDSERGHRPWEGPQREIRIQPFALGLREVTFDEWEACVADGGCNRYTPSDKGWGRATRPAMMVSWNDAQAYVAWLRTKTSKPYRLPSEAEWEYAARGGSVTAYWWGEAFERGRTGERQTLETGTLGANGFGLFDVTGNLAEWVEDCYLNDFSRIPDDGRAATDGNCSQRVVRGGSWRDRASALRIANRSRIGRGVRDSTIGFRVAMTPTP